MLKLLRFLFLLNSNAFKMLFEKIYDQDFLCRILLTIVYLQFVTNIKSKRVLYSLFYKKKQYGQKSNGIESILICMNIYIYQQPTKSVNMKSGWKMKLLGFQRKREKMLFTSSESYTQIKYIHLIDIFHLDVQRLLHR